MGKNLRGRELGTGLSQRKDGKYSARFTRKNGQKAEKHFDKLGEAKEWLKKAVYDDENRVLTDTSYMTVDQWFEFWMKTFKSNKSLNTQRNYRDRYQGNIKPLIGHMLVTDIKTMHCQNVLNQMIDDYAGGTIYQTYICLGAMLKSAVQNDIIPKQPMDGVEIPKARKLKSDIHYLTIEEEQAFLETIEDTHNKEPLSLVLQTGLRTGELIGLTWDAIDWEERTITVNKTLEYRHSRKYWRAGPPKTMAGYRTIPMTDEAYRILQDVYGRKDFRKQSPILSQVLEFTDPRNDRTVKLPMRELVFLNFRTGEPTKNSSYDTFLYKMCDKAGIERFCMHALRHTFATRCIERGVQPKALQKILGHASLATTMDTYVHVTDASMQEAMKKFEDK